jgi:NADH-ubiquinone oxidoreductase chain 4
MVWGNLGYIFGCDYISYGLILLRFWICVLIIMARESIFRSVYYPNLFLVFLVVLMVILFCTFSRINLFSFYLFFESRLIPTVFLILGWGYQPERLQAGIYLLFYTLLASLPMLVGIFYVYNFLGSTCFYLFVRLNSLSVLFYFCIVFAFLVKIPIFLVHL